MAIRFIQTVFKRQEKPYVHPYLAGAILGVVLFLAFLLTGNGLGSSGATSRIDAALVDMVAPAHVDRGGGDLCAPAHRRADDVGGGHDS